MPKLYSSKQIAKILENHGFTLLSQKGSHGKFRKTIEGKVLTTIVPMGKREIPAGTLSSILRQSRLNKEDFE
ncbi:type II toxin-antitoxin system HicA family toxin [Candidatus Microgenomates bacterium]|nr:type II toxin-antitoxin system HicA family toxin [Candidatus Microgenomates bacterium]